MAWLYGLKVDRGYIASLNGVNYAQLHMYAGV